MHLAYCSRPVHFKISGFSHGTLEFVLCCLDTTQSLSRFPVAMHVNGPHEGALDPTHRVKWPNIQTKRVPTEITSKTRGDQRHESKSVSNAPSS